MTKAKRPLLTRLLTDISGVAAIEFALTAPIVMTMFLSGAELANYAIARMRIAQIAVHVADNGSRVGQDSPFTLKQLSESQINDLLIGANLQAGTMDLLHRGRVVLSSLEPMASPNQARFYVHWQRCYGQKAFTSDYGAQGATNLTTFGPPGKQITAVPAASAIIYVEISYNYKPLISARLIPTTTLKDVATMVVRDERDMTQIYNTEGVTPSTCPT